MTAKSAKFKVGDIVKCFDIFGVVINTQHGIEVRFPDPFENSSFTLQKFHPSGRLFSYGGPILLQFVNNLGHETIDNMCRRLTRGNLQGADVIEYPNLKINCEVEK